MDINIFNTLNFSVRKLFKKLMLDILKINLLSDIKKILSNILKINKFTVKYFKNKFTVRY